MRYFLIICLHVSMLVRLFAPIVSVRWKHCIMMCPLLPNSTFGDVALLDLNQPGWEYLTRETDKCYKLGELVIAISQSISGPGRPRDAQCGREERRAIDLLRWGTQSSERKEAGRAESQDEPRWGAAGAVRADKKESPLNTWRGPEDVGEILFWRFPGPSPVGAPALVLKLNHPPCQGTVSMQSVGRYPLSYLLRVTVGWVRFGDPLIAVFV